MCSLRTVQVTRHLKFYIPLHTYRLANVLVLAPEMLYPCLQCIALLQLQTCCCAQANSIHVWSLENREVMTANPFPLVHAVRRIQKRLEGPDGKGHGMTVPVLHTDSGQPYILFQVSAPSPPGVPVRSFGASKPLIIKAAILVFRPGQYCHRHVGCDAGRVLLPIP